MIFRTNAKCSTCNTTYTLRINVGHNSWQEHTFPCKECSEDIKIALELDFQNISGDIKYLENCAEGQEEGIIINLHPGFLISKGDINKDQTFPGLEQSLEIFNAIDPEKLKRKIFKNKQPRILGIADEWKILKKAWSFYKNNQHAFLEKYLINNFGEEPNSFKEYLFSFTSSMVNKIGMKKVDGVGKLCKQISNKNSSKHKRFLEVFSEEYFDDHLLKYFDIFKEFFDNFSEFNQTLIYSSLGIPFKDDFEATSIGFEKTKMFYGNAYEVLTHNLITLAFISNLEKGRKHDKFESLTLKKYLELDKSSKCGPFKDIPTLMEFGDCLDNQLRNASHHKAIKLDQKTNIVHYTFGKSGNSKTMPYSHYLRKCTDIFINVGSLLNLELILNQQYQDVCKK